MIRVTETIREQREAHACVPTRFAIHCCGKFLQHPLKRVSTAVNQSKYQHYNHQIKLNKKKIHASIVGLGMGGGKQGAKMAHLYNDVRSGMVSEGSEQSDEYIKVCLACLFSSALITPAVPRRIPQPKDLMIGEW